MRPVALFGASGVGGNDAKWSEITINTPASYWQDGNNTLVFRHLSTMGYVIDQATVSFTSSTNTPTPNAPTANALLSVDFQNIDRGGASAVRYTKEQLESDFQWDMLGYSHQEGGNNYYGPLGAPGDYQADRHGLSLTQPVIPGAGNVLRVSHHQSDVDGPPKRRDERQS